MTHKVLLTRFVLVLTAAAAGTMSCGSPNTPSTTRVGITGTLNLSAIGKTSQLTATLYKTDGSTQNVTNDSEWTTDNQKVATISSTGLLTAVGFGTTKVTATYNRQKSLGGTDTLTDQKQAQVVQPAATSVRLTGTLSLTSVGATSQLTLTATLTDGSTIDVTGQATWTIDDPSVASLQPGGLLIANGLGVTSLTVTFSGRFAFGTIVVTPPGTIATGGRVRLPGNGEGEGLGVAGFQIVDTRSGLTTTSNAEGRYTMGGLISGTRLTFNKDGFEPTERVVTGTDGQVAVQKIVRIAAGETAQSLTAPNDVSYSVNPSGPCLNCRLIRVVVPASGTLHLTLSWDTAAVTENLWIQGQIFNGTSPGPLTVDVPVAPGELVVYAGTAKASVGRYVNLKLATALAAPSTLR